MICTKSDLCYSMELLAWFMTNPFENHFKTLNQIWKYFIYIKNLGLYYLFEDLNFIDYYDTNWRKNFNTRKSIFDYIFLFKNGVITWKSILQKMIALFFIKIEYMEFKKIIKESIFLQQFLKSVFFLKEYNAKQLYTNNESTKILFKNPLFHKKTKHINIQYHYVWKYHINEFVNIHHVFIKQQLANQFIKSLNIVKMEFFIFLVKLAFIDNINFSKPPKQV